MRIAITGTTGYLGRFVVEILLDAGYTVVAQVRRTLNTSDPLTKYDGKLELINGNMEDVASLENLVHRCDAVVHMAFMSATGSYRGGEGDDPAWFWDQNFGGTLRLLRACQAANIAKFIFLSSRAVFDGCRISDRPVDDTDEPVPANHYGLLKWSSELLANLYDEMTFCSLRPTGIYGLSWPRDRTKWWNLVTDPLLPDRDLSSLSSKVYTEVHGADVAAAALLLLQQRHNDVHRRSFNCSDILVSERYLVQRCLRLLNSTSDKSSIDQLQPPINNMGTAGLTKLGWRGGGVKKLRQTLHEIQQVSEQL